MYWGGFLACCTSLVRDDFVTLMCTSADRCLQHMPVEMFTPCLIDLCKALWEVMKSYHKTIKWHQDHDMEPDTEIDNGASSGQGTPSFLFSILSLKKSFLNRPIILSYN